MLLEGKTLQSGRSRLSRDAPATGGSRHRRRATARSLEIRHPCGRTHTAGARGCRSRRTLAELVGGQLGADLSRVRLSDLPVGRDLADIAFDSGVQLGAGEVVSVRSQELASNTSIEQRLRKETATIVEELLAV